MTRRAFLGSALPVVSVAQNMPQAPQVCLFTDHLAGFAYKEVAVMLREIGVIGPDLTVRPGGLVNPQRVTVELPKAAAVFRDHGLTIPMITTAITSAKDPSSRAILSSASKLGIKFYKLGYYDYQDTAKWRESLAATRRDLEDLAALSRKLGIRAGFHNHSGSLGGPLWDAWEIVDPLDAKSIGYYFDPAQAMIEGGKLGWRLGFRRSSERLTMVAIKDFIWEKSSSGWRTRWVPLGEGMVPWPEFFRMLREVRWPGPVTLHIEYDPGGKTKTERYDKALDAAARDFRFLKQQMKTAGGHLGA